MLMIPQLPQQIIHRMMIQIHIGKTEMLDTTMTRVVFNHNRAAVMRKFQYQIIAAQQKMRIALTNAIQNQRILAMTVMNRVMAIACAIVVFIIAPIAFHTIIAPATIQHIIAEFGLQIIIAVLAKQAIIKIAANELIIAILAMHRTAAP